MMEFPEPSKVLFNRIKKLEPDNCNKIVGYLLLQGLSEQEIINLALSHDAVIQEVILKTKAQLSLCLKSPPSPISTLMNSPPVSELSLPFTPFSQFSSHPFDLPAAFCAPSPNWGSQVAAKHNSDFMPMSYPDSVSELQSQTQFLSLEDQMEPVNVENAGFPSHCAYSDAVFGDLSARGPRYQSFNEFPIKTCHYFNKGFCKHGSNCRYFHGQISDGFPQKFDAFNDDHIFSPGSLEKLELEIKELLKSRKGNPVSIASLPMIYYEKYGKVLQADGYLTESQRHGRAGYSLTKLLARLKNSIQLIDRPHGQHAVILAEDAPKYLDNRGDRNDPGQIVSGSRQIYLTFPSESTFSEDDVSNYFNTFGPVEDVRIPCQQKRMFGFVTFESADTVKMVLAKRNPHYVCGARVLVKPYREKLKLIERKYHERTEPSMYYFPHYLDMEAELHSMPRGYETSRLLRKQIMEAQEQAFELERRRLAELQTIWKPTSKQSYFGYSMDDLKVSEENFTPPSEHISHLLDVLNTSSASDEKIKHAESNYANQDSNQGLNLPESPFASPIVSSIS